jgi:CPA2 family monovalent cation:H+ antiporter-2
LPTSVDSALLTGHVAIVGYGRVGKRIVAALRERNVPFTIAEENRELVESMRGEGMHAVSGDANDPAVLIQAHVARAAMLVIATPDTVGVRKMVEVARKLNPKIQIVLRTHSDDEATLLRQENCGEVFMGEHELAKAMTRHVLERMEGRSA